MVYILFGSFLDLEKGKILVFKVLYGDVYDGFFLERFYRS